MVSDRIKYLDGLRGFAILIVLLYHAYARWTHIEPYQQVPAIQAATAYGWLGVQLFFAISGYVIYMSLLRSRTLVLFAVGRWLRLAPAMLVASLIILLTAWLIPERPSGAVSAIDLLPSLTFLDPQFWKTAFGVEVKSLDGVFWSLYVEVKFYAIAALLFFGLRDRALHGLLMIYLSFLAFAVLQKIFPENDPINDIRFALDYLGARHFGWFLLGIYTYQYVTTDSRMYLAAACAISFVSSAFLLFGESLTIGLVVCVACVPALFLLPIFHSRTRSLLSHPLIVFLGFISYPLYLLHQNIVTALAIKLSAIWTALPPVLLPMPGFIFVTVIAFALAKAEPLMRRTVERLLPSYLFGAQRKRIDG